MKHSHIGFFVLSVISCLVFNAGSVHAEETCSNEVTVKMASNTDIVLPKTCEEKVTVKLASNTDVTLPKTCEEEVPVIETDELIDISIPTHTYAKTYEDGSLITDETSEAYKWLNQCTVDERGHYIYDGKYYAVALGNYFNDVGSKYKVTFDSGNTIYVIKCDTKKDEHTTNQMIGNSGEIIEFIIDTHKASSYYGVGDNGYILDGSFDNHDDFNGKVVKIEEII